MKENTQTVVIVNLQDIHPQGRYPFDAKAKRFQMFLSGEKENNANNFPYDVVLEAEKIVSIEYKKQGKPTRSLQEYAKLSIEERALLTKDQLREYGFGSTPNW